MTRDRLPDLQHYLDGDRNNVERVQKVLEDAGAVMLGES